MSRNTFKVIIALAVCAFLVSVVVLHADEFTEQDKERWQEEFMTVVKEGRSWWTNPDLGTNGVSCAQCHPNAANTHPETYPKFQQQLGKVVALRDMINWCIQNPLEGPTLDLDDPVMVALETYIAYERRGVALEPGKH